MVLRTKYATLTENRPFLRLRTTHYLFFLPVFVSLTVGDETTAANYVYMPTLPVVGLGKEWRTIMSPWGYLNRKLSLIGLYLENFDSR